MVFAKIPQRKIVMSTNLAETSITIDDCVFVVEAGRMKEKGFDSTKNMESLDTVWVSQANALQVGLFCALNRYNSQNRLTLCIGIRL